MYILNAYSLHIAMFLTKYLSQELRGYCLSTLHALGAASPLPLRPPIFSLQADQRAACAAASVFGLSLPTCEVAQIAPTTTTIATLLPSTHPSAVDHQRGRLKSLSSIAAVT